VDNISEARLIQVAPELARRIRQLAAALDADGVELHVTSGYRNYSAQSILYAMGRTSLGPIVTDAKPGYSMHNFGLAVDVDPFVDGKPDWDENSPEWAAVLSKFGSFGLASGSQWCHIKDLPHLYPVEVPATPDDNIRYLFESGGVEAVWKEFQMQEEHL
jgi:peptidoglycan LD-endopeptidase CwlK